MNDAFVNAATFLIQTLFSMYLLAVLFRLLLQIARADFYNPLSQAIVKVTDPALRPLRRVVPGFGGLDIASILLILVIQIALICLILLLNGHAVPNILQVIAWAGVGVFALVLKIYTFSIIILVILSWVAPHSQHPAAVLIGQLIEPVMRPMRKVLPPMGGLDLSPLFALIAITLVEILLVQPLAASVKLPTSLLLGI